MDALTLLTSIGGLGLLLLGAQALVRGASRLAITVGISPLLVGLTVVSYGTSSPELVISMQASLSGQADIGLGNVVGSNIFNVLLILGASALIVPLVVAQRMVRVEVPVMIGVSVAFWLAAIDGRLDRWEAALLVVGLLLYTTVAILSGRNEKREVAEEYDALAARQRFRTAAGPAANLGLVLAGLAMLVIGSRWLVDGAVQLARHLGLSELIIGLTIIAAGTSLPEVATSILAAVKGERDIAVGNVVGSNIFNILGVAGLAGVVSPQGLPISAPALSFDIPVMTAVAIACLPIFFTGHSISRWEGGVFLLYYAVYTAFLILDASDHDLLPAFSWIMSLFVLPMTALTLGVVMFRAWRLKRPRGPGQ